MKRIFLSYRHMDGKNHMEKIKQWLDPVYDVRVDKDWVWGTGFDSQMKIEVDNADLVIAVKTPKYNGMNTGYEIIESYNQNKLVEIKCELNADFFYSRTYGGNLSDYTEGEFLQKVDQYLNQKNASTKPKLHPHPQINALLEVLHDLESKINDTALVIKDDYGNHVKLGATITSNDSLYVTLMIGSKIDESFELYARKSQFMGNFILTKKSEGNSMSADDYALIDGVLTSELAFNEERKDIKLGDFPEFYYQKYIEPYLPE